MDGRYAANAWQTRHIAEAETASGVDLEAELRAAAIDPSDACREGKLIMLDAAATLAAFMPAGEIDRATFNEVVGSVVRQAVEQGPGRPSAVAKQTRMSAESGPKPEQESGVLVRGALSQNCFMIG